MAKMDGAKTDHTVWPLSDKVGLRAPDKALAEAEAWKSAE
jgi:hypothetical protein